jgi:flagellar FliL protein
MADDKNTPEVDPAAASKGGSKLVPILLVLILVAVLGGGGAFAAMHFGLIGGGEASAKTDESAEEAPPEAGPPAYVALDPFVVNLNEPGPPRYLKLTFSVEVPGSGNDEKVATNVPRIRDRVLTYLSGLRLTEVQGRDAKTNIKSQLLAILQETVPDDVVQNVLFMEFVVQ